VSVFFFPGLNRLRKNALRESTTTDRNCHPERSPNPPGEDESRDPENPTNTHALVMYFYQNVSNLTVIPGNASKTHNQRATEKSFYKAVRASSNMRMKKLLRQHRYDSTIGILRLFIAPSSLRNRSGRQVSIVFCFRTTIFSQPVKPKSVLGTFIALLNSGRHISPSFAQPARISDSNFLHSLVLTAHKQFFLVHRDSSLRSECF
jgi:hypothetical protein